LVIKDVMVWVDGSLADDVRLEVAGSIARRFESQVIALILNSISLPVSIAEGFDGGVAETTLLEKARAVGDLVEEKIVKHLKLLDRPVEIRRFDVLADDITKIAVREARAADTFVALRPDGAMDPERLVEAILFGSGRHLFLFPEVERPKIAFDRIILAWNGSRESARAMAEGIPFLQKANEVTVTVITDTRIKEENVLVGTDAVRHLKHHGIEAGLHRVKGRKNDPGLTLIAEARRRKADLIIMGGYGHLRLRERLLGGVTYELTHESPVPILIAH
jgi:nucleotide-binding universal stress UspA family protein